MAYLPKLTLWLAYCKINQSILDGLSYYTKRDFGVSDLYIINPEQQKIINEIKNYRFGQVIRLPKITCMALITNFKNYSKDLDSLLDIFEEDYTPPLHFQNIVLIWFQDNFAFPVDNKVLEKLKNTTWEDILKKVGVSLSKEISKEKIEKELQYLNNFLKGVDKKLSNEHFINNATEKKKKADTEDKIKTLEESFGEFFK